MKVQKLGWRLGVMVTGAKTMSMETTKRATVYCDPEIHRALRLKAAATERSVSDLVNEAVELALGEDAEDLEVFEKRRGEPVLSFDDVVKDLRRRGRI
jgi:aspartate/methionine/tyrosine aminotransferase